MGKFREFNQYFWEKYGLVILLGELALMLLCGVVAAIAAICSLPGVRVFGWFGLAGLVISLGLTAWAIINEIKSLKC